MTMAGNEKSKTPEEKYEEASFELAVYRMMQRDNDTVDRMLNEESKAEIDCVSEMTMPEMLKMIDRKSKELWSRKNIKKQFSFALKAVASVILIINIGLTIAVAASNEVRVRVINFLTEINESYMSMGFGETGEETTIPVDWSENYFPSSIPEGYVIKQYAPHEGSSHIVYENPEGYELSISVYGTDVTCNINVEQASISYAFVHDVTATVLHQSYGMIDIIWATGDHYFIVSSNEDYETALSVASSMALIKK